MATQLLTTDQVKEYLNITDFRHLTKDKIVKFISAIPAMDKDIAIRIIEQFPDFTKYAQSIISYYKSIYISTIDNNNNSVQYVMNGYMKTLTILNTLIDSEQISSEDKRIFAEMAVEIANNMASFDSNNKVFLSEIIKHISGITCRTILITVAFYGLVIKGNHIPHII